MTGVDELPRAVLEHYDIRIREPEVVRTERITPRMHRVTFGGESMRGLETHAPDDHVKLLFPDADGSLRVPTARGDGWLDWPRPLPITRDYTIRRYDPVALEADIDFVVHPGGRASAWALAAQPGDRIWMAGPPRGVIVPDAFRWQACFGDETALPAIARRLAEMPRLIVGHAVIEVQDAAEEQELDAPDGVEVRWLHRGDAAPGSTTLLADAAAAIEIPRDGRAFVWAGGETFAIKPIRAWVAEAGLGKHERDFAGYWRRGVLGDDHEVDLDDEDDDHEHDHDH